MVWTISFHDAAREELADQPDDIVANFLRFSAIIREQGLIKLPRHATRHLRDELWELRLKGKDGIARALYVTRSGERLVVVRVFAKKTQKTPPREIRLALQRAAEIE
jgi:phage-related protein